MSNSPGSENAAPGSGVTTMSLTAPLTRLRSPAMTPALAPLPPAHASHWALWVLYAVPVVVVLAAVVAAVVRERRVDRD